MYSGKLFAKVQDQQSMAAWTQSAIIELVPFCCTRT